MSDKAVLVDFGLSVQMTEEIYIPRDLRGTEVREERKFKGCRKEWPVFVFVPCRECVFYRQDLE